MSRTTAFHPESNGLIERFHRSLKNSLISATVGPSWHLRLPLILLGLRAAPRDKEGVSAAEQMFGTAVSLPGDFWSPTYSVGEDFLKKFQDAIASSPPPPSIPKRNVVPSIPTNLQSCKFVFVRIDAHKPPLTPLYTGPYLVLRRYTHTFCLQIGTREDTVNISRLKPAHTPDCTQAALSPRRGRPLLLQSDYP